MKKLAKVTYNDIDKTASNVQDVATITGIGLAASIGGGLLVAGGRKAKELITRGQVWNKLIEEHPEFNNPKTEELYKAIYSTNPSQMKHLPFLVPTLRQAGEYGTDGAPPQLVKLLVDTEHSKAQTNANKNRILDRALGHYSFPLTTPGERQNRLNDIAMRTPPDPNKP